MGTIYRLTLTLDFDDETVRDSAHNKIKNALGNVKATDAWVSGQLNKTDYYQPNNVTENV